MSLLLILLILIPLLASVLIMVGANPRRTALGAAILNLIVSIVLFARYDLHAGGWQFLSDWKILPRLGITMSLGADGLTMTMLLLATLVTLSSLWVAPKIEKMEGLYYVCLLFISAGVIGAFASLNIFFLYSFHELALIPTFLLIGIWGTGDRQSAAWKATIYLGLGSFVLLIGLLALYLSLPSNLRTFDLRQLSQLALAGTFHPASWIYLVLLVGFGSLVSLFPFHSWAPPAYACAPAPAAMMHAGVLKKFGLYGLIRIALPLFPEAMVQFNGILILLLICNILYIGYVTVAQKRLDWMVGYSSVMHMGYIFLGLASLNLLGINGASLLMFAHGLSVAAAFALCGEIRSRPCVGPVVARVTRQSQADVPSLAGSSGQSAAERRQGMGRAVPSLPRQGRRAVHADRVSPRLEHRRAATRRLRLGRRRPLRRLRPVEGVDRATVSLVSRPA